MPAYDFECPQCGWKGEMLQVVYTERGDQSCPRCDEPLGSPMPSAPVVHGPQYQMAAVMPNGEKIKGHFGKDAKRRRKK